ncbi:MAG TPA: TIGR00730 family Rossman fold protein [Acidimicrobiia bacterium]|nr:TIGR00730 family Rossman fold protein [Acidimicrobiia bacterium]
MTALRRVCVFCGSKTGARPEYAAAARAMGSALAAEGIDLVYGGGQVGLMGLVADAVLGAGGEVIGVIPEHMSGREIAHYGLTELRIVSSMHERKALMYELSDGFAALPGGLGTLEELFEITTWSQLGLHAKPTGLLDVGGFYAPLVAFLDQLVSEGFVSERHRRLLRVAAEPVALLRRLAAFPD